MKRHTIDKQYLLMFRSRCVQGAQVRDSEPFGYSFQGSYAPLQVLLNMGQLVRFKKNRWVDNDHLAARVLLVLEGEFEVVYCGHEGHELTLGNRCQGQLLGSAGSLGASCADIRYRALFDASCASITRRSFDQCLRSDINLLHLVNRQLAENLLRTTEKSISIACDDVYRRVYMELRERCSMPSAVTHPQGMQIRLSRQDLARAVASSREAVGRALRELETDGYLQIRGSVTVVYGERKMLPAIAE